MQYEGNKSASRKLVAASDTAAGEAADIRVLMMKTGPLQAKHRLSTKRMFCHWALCGRASIKVPAREVRLPLDHHKAPPSLPSIVWQKKQILADYSRCMAKQQSPISPRQHIRLARPLLTLDINWMMQEQNEKMPRRLK